MVSKHHLEQVGDVTIIRFDSRPDALLLEQVIKTLEAGRVGLRLWDFSVGAEVSSDEVRMLAKRKAPFVPEKTAILSTDDRAYGLARMYEVHSELEERFQVFRSEDEALSWLNKSG